MEPSRASIQYPSWLPAVPTGGSAGGWGRVVVVVGSDAGCVMVRVTMAPKPLSGAKS
ncbi:hypothetical protein D3C83_336040 [compost metagenome]